MITSTRFQDTTVTRKTEKEARQAIDDLLRRGYEVIYPLTQITNDGKQWKRDAYGRNIFIQNTPKSSWKAKLRRVIK
ncbi:hypothetical protein AM500_21505 [Bacillus sp. FJAT-18017]|uniref:hypothetical protein n=1 Tax=Bacillus sp. FJAT-18017 TaxID=1705566 RepID=UPI0006AE4189|nr:hypothetical protein [Bacillus sp. FJAT-18017]ALC92079.1 hypothetical protein AM500_21505 [Bacillus sp. FJAT-18017]